MPFSPKRKACSLGNTYCRLGENIFIWGTTETKSKVEFWLFSPELDFSRLNELVDFHPILNTQTQKHKP